jgi:2'-5' RNA ligase
MRLFVAIDVGPAIASAAGGIVEELKVRAAKLAPRAKVTWIPPNRIHLTVRFIGHVDDAQHRKIASVLEPALSIHAFDLRIRGAGAFPKSGPPRAIWCGVSDGLEQLQGVEQEVTGRLKTIGVQPENRPFSPHLTLARVREAHGLRSSTLLETVRDRDLGTTRVEAITLFESRLSSKGPTYVSLQETTLRRT